MSKRHDSYVFGLFCAVSIIIGLSSAIHAATVTWSGAEGISWDTPGNWSNSAGPGTGDTASFNDTGASVLPGDVTSILDVSRSINGLTFNNTATKFQTLDLNTAALTVTGNVTFNLDQPALSTTTIRNGALSINSAFATFNVGRGASGSSKSIVDLSGLTSLSGTLQDMYIGSSTASGASGTLTLSHASNNLTLQHIYVGTANSSSEVTGLLHLGLDNTLAVGEFDIGKDTGTGTVDIAPGGTLNLGTPAARTLLQIGVEVNDNPTNYTAKLDLASGTLSANLSSVTVGQKQGGGGTAIAVLNGGSAGAIDIGAPGNTANFYVGRQLTGGGGSSGTVDFSGANTLTASLNAFTVGTALSGNAFGSVKLAKTNSIDANSIVVGQNGGNTNLLQLGKNATIHANSFTIAQENASATVSVTPGGSVVLGSAAQRTDLLIASSAANTNGNMVGKLDLTGASFTAFLGNVTVGERDGPGGGASEGSIVGANGGSIDIGSPTPGNTANFYVAHQLTNGSSAVGNVDFSGLSTLTASLNNLSVGTALTGSANGTLILAQTNNISAKNITIGLSGDATLALGDSNTILANQLIISQNYSNAKITLPGGGTLNLGSPSQRTTLLMATGVTNTNSTYSGMFDLTNGTVTAYLANVTIGNKDSQSGAEDGTFSIGTSPANYIEAANITLGGTRSTGTLNFGGGVFIANSIAKGAGTGNFNWSGGRLSVGTFGTNTTSFNVANSGTGTLAPGSASQPLGTTIVYGNYTQGAAASTELDISATGNDLVTVSGSATLNGTLTLKSLNNFTPSVGQSFLLENYASHAGTYAFVAPPKLGADTAFQLDYSNPTQLLLRIVAPNTANYVAPAATGTWATAASWDTLAVPSTITATNVVNSGASPKIVTVGASTTVHRVNLQGGSAAAPLDLEILQGVRFGVSNQLVIGANATLTGGGTVLGDVIAAGGASIAPGPVPASPAMASPGILQVGGNLNTQAASNLNVEIGGTVAGTNYDRLAVGGNASFSGNLAVKLINGFSPAPLQQFDIVTYATHSGSFTANGPISAGGSLVFAPIYLADRLTLIATIPGDVTTDGKVSFADLVAMAQNYGSTHATWSTGDLNNDGNVNFADLVILAQNYGQGVASTGAVPGASAEFNEAWAAAVSSVPEPGMIGVLAIGSIALFKRRRKN